MKTLVNLFLAAAAMVSAANRTGTFTGIITDTMCKKDHAMMKINPDARCVSECVKSHEGKYALFDGTNLYPLADQTKPAALAGKQVKIKGTLYGKAKILTIDSIAPAK